MARPIPTADFHPASVAPDDLALLLRLLRPAAPFPQAREIALSLLNECGTLAEVIFAPEERLARLPYVTHKAISEIALTRTLQEDLARARIKTRQLITNWSDLVSYCRVTLAHRRTECFRVLFLDRKNHLIRDEDLAIGTVDQVTVHTRQVIGRALELGASALILIHNHPSGDTQPSPNDEVMTARLKDAAALFDIQVHDHVIISTTGAHSMRASGQL
jgi:DNA repair protein RadC